MMNRRHLFRLLGTAAIIGNAVFVLWILYNGMDEGWRATPVQLASYVGLMLLLALNTVLVALNLPR
jgi:hypothetical protein